MANNALIQGAARTGKKFLDVGGAVQQVWQQLQITNLKIG